MTLGECINRYLSEHNMSMRTFASNAGVSHTYISYLVNGKTPRGSEMIPTIDKYESIARAMGMDVSSLIGIVNDKIAWGTVSEPVSEYDSEEQWVLSCYRRADKDTRDAIKILLRKYEQENTIASSHREMRCDDAQTLV